MTEWAARALGLVLDRVESTLDSVGDRFPLYADPVTGEWHTTGRGSWAGGCWVGLLWLRARITGTSTHRGQAEQWTRRLEYWADADTAVRGLILWYGAAAGARLGLSSVGEPIAERGARALCASFHERAGVLAWGTAFGEGDGDGDGDVSTRVDAVAGATPLLAWLATRHGCPPDQPESRARRIAAEHLRQHIRLCLAGEDLVPAWTWREQKGAWTPADDPPSGWSRGLAWLMLAAADAVAWLGPAFKPSAGALAQRWLREQTDQRIPPAIRGHPGAPPDTSAAAIAALALLKLDQRNKGTELLRALVDHLTDGRDGRPAGSLLDGCYDLARGVAIRSELVWGDFFFAVGLAIAAGVISADAL